MFDRLVRVHASDRSRVVSGKSHAALLGTTEWAFLMGREQGGCHDGKICQRVPPIIKRESPARLSADECGLSSQAVHPEAKSLE